LRELPVNPLLAAYALTDIFIDKTNRGVVPAPARNHQYAQAYRIFSKLCSSGGLKVQTDVPTINDNANGNINNITRFFQAAKGELTPKVMAYNTQKEVEAAVELADKRFADTVGKGFAYEFSEEDLTELQSSINRMRQILLTTAVFDGHSKGALLNRLEALQRELNRRMASLDAFFLFGVDFNAAMQRLKLTTKGFHEITTETKGAVDDLYEIARKICLIAAFAFNTAQKLPTSTQLPLHLPPPAIEIKVEPAQEEDGRT